MDADLSVRRAGITDLDAALPLMQRFFTEEGFDTPSRQIARELPVMLANPEYAVFLAWQGAGAVGIATVTTSRGIELGLSAEMEDLYVLPERRGRGAGRALIQAVVAWCRSRHCTSIEVVVTPEGQAAHDLIGYYRSHGFQETGRVILSQPILRESNDPDEEAK